MKKLGILLAVLLALSCLAGCGSRETAVSAPELLEPVGVQIDTAVVQFSDMVEIVYKSNSDGSRGDVYEGKILPYVEPLYFGVSGTLDELNAVQGDEVKEGQVLATLDPEQLNERISDLRDQINNLNTVGAYDDKVKTADIKIAQIQLEMLKEAGASEEALRVKELDIQLLQTQLKQAGEERALQIRELERQIGNLSKGLTDLELKAPFDGRIVYVDSSLQTYGSNHVTASKAVFYIADESRLRIETDYIAERILESSERVYALIDGQEYDLVYVPYDSAEFLEMVRDNNLKTRFTFADSTEELISGQTVYLILVKQSRKHVLTVPTNALYEDGGEYFVKKIVDGQQVRTEVSVGLVTDAKAEILSGLQEGDVVYVKE